MMREMEKERKYGGQGGVRRAEGINFGNKIKEKSGKNWTERREI
jgi:hypothetical protein